MGKKTVMQDANPYDEYVKTFLDRKFKNQKHRDNSLEILNQLSNVVNKDVCLTRGQQAFTGALISSVGFEIEDVKRIDSETAKIATLVNSFRNDCENCMNKNCEMRDLEKP